jgi:hypothetical protein
MLIRSNDGVWRDEEPSRVEYDPKVLPEAWRATPNGSYTFESPYQKRKRQAERWISMNERNASNA